MKTTLRYNVTYTAIEPDPTAPIIKKAQEAVKNA